MILRPPESTRTDTPFPDTTLFRSQSSNRARRGTTLGSAPRRSCRASGRSRGLGNGVAWSRFRGVSGVPYGAVALFFSGPGRKTPAARTGYRPRGRAFVRSEEHTSELQSLMRISYAVFCFKKKIRFRKVLGIVMRLH